MSDSDKTRQKLMDTIRRTKAGNAPAAEEKPAEAAAPKAPAKPKAAASKPAPAKAEKPASAPAASGFSRGRRVWPD